MILARLDNVTVYRMHAPKWAVAPTSGAGAAKHGGRVNRPGVGTLLALEAECVFHSKPATDNNEK
ncbi:hypothetical protein TPL01_13480 [Sulfuriferula plumbiphila]|uniref:RES domain-containing protein n=2 Tax=Sulfuriferula plumbiphila TaxID=171865 RepID=A0A512L6U9_9PROT|nr:hypothetical protein SFPGR_03450 [Sulfuriferula plumbiphila]GEP30210.1 hypothetical protein TPL01_13480 [Sulfuriferula plumbiphila]